MLKNSNFKKAKIINRIILFIFFIILSRYFFVQVLSKQEFINSASKNKYTNVQSIPPRGIIYDRNGKVIVSNRNTFSIKIYPNHYNESFNINLFYDIIYNAQKRSILNVEKSKFKDLVLRHRENSIRRYKPITIINFIDFKTKALLSEHKNDFPGLIFSINPSRFYQDSLNLSHVLGYLRPVPQDSVYVGSYYAINDIIGIDGIEKFYEKQLRGKKGKESHIINTYGKDLGVDKKKSIPYVPGDDLFLTIDYDLQIFIEKLLSNHKGSIICMNPLNGEILAMASAPDFSLSQFIGPLKYDTWKAWNKQKRLVNRSTAGTYHPGSLYKLVTSIMFLDKQMITKEEKVYCDGKFELEDQSNPDKPKIFRCWKKEGHGNVNLHDAIVQSCNVYFYDKILKNQEQNKYIIDELHNYALMLGLDKKVGIEIFEKKGRIPNSDWMELNYGKTWPKRGSMPNLSIGQGSNAITPLQAINLINIISMQGKVIQPTLILGNKTNISEIKISKYVWDEIQKAMFDVVNEELGTAYYLNDSKAIIRGKTGTAQTVSSSTNDYLLSWFGGYMELQDNLFSLIVLIEDTNSDTKSIAKILSKEIFNFIKRKIDNE
tara:strand:- start:29249 stop:31054 length:1806 start_codon:yes stop_codon:yes gene_type:complete